MQAGEGVADGTMAALADAALHPALEVQENHALVAVKVLHGLYQRAARIGDRRQR